MIVFFYSKPVRSHVETEVICTIPHKVTLLTSGPAGSTAKHPKKGVSFFNSIPFNFDNLDVYLIRPLLLDCNNIDIIF